MKKNYLLLLISSAGILLCAPNALTAQTWQVTDIQLSSIRFEDIAFPTPHKGFMVGNETIYRTEDGGDHWEPVFTTTGYLRSLEFLDTLIGFAGTLDGQLYRTADGGDTWVDVAPQVPGFLYGICGMSHVGTQTIIGVGIFNDEAQFIRSDNQGIDWTYKDMDTLASSLVEVHFFDDQTGIIGGVALDGLDAVILRTEDGGETWTTVYESNRPLEFVWKFDALSNDLIYGSVENISGLASYALKSEDGGNSWQELLVSTDHHDLQGIGFRNELEGWVGPRDSGMFHTEDGGQTWVQNSTIPNINRILRINENLLYASGSFFYRNGDVPTSINLPLAATIKPIITHISPNPFASTFQFTVNVPPTGQALIELIDQNGKVMRQIDNRSFPVGENTITIEETESWPSGVYYIFVRCKEGHAGAKVVKQ